LDLDLDPEPLAVEPVLVTLLEPAQRLVALKQILQRAAPRVMDAHGVVGGGEPPGTEARPRSVRVPVAEPIEDPLAVPPLEDLPLNCRMIGDRSQGFEDLIGHMFDFTEAREHVSRPAR